MRTRAILIGIEQYRDDSEVGSSLPGTLANIEAFRQWLTERNPNDLQIKVAKGSNGLGPSSGDVIDVFRSAAKDWREGYDELFVYIAGHGFSYKNQPFFDYVDVLVCSDFVNAAESGRACIMIPEMQFQLRGIGPGVQHWFVEICRVVTNGINVAPSGLTVPPSPLGSATINTLFATTPGMLQDVGDTFNRALVDALRGVGRAKVHDQGRWIVNFQRLAAFVSARMRAHLAREASERSEDSGRILVMLQQVAPQQCHIEVIGANANASFQVDVWSGSNQLVLDGNGRFQGNHYDIALQPGDYEIEVKSEEGALDRIAPPKGLVDLYDNREMRFSAQSALESIAIPVVRKAKIEVFGMGVARVRLKGLHHDEWIAKDAIVPVPPGDYAAELVDASGVIASRQIKVASGNRMKVDFRHDGITPLHEAIARKTGTAPDTGVILSESLGRLDSRDLNVWLGMIGAGRVMGFGDFGELPSLEDLPKGASGLLVLSTLEGAGAPHEVVFVGNGVEAHWPLQLHSSLSVSIACGVVPTGSPGVLVFHENWALATTLLPDRVTVVTLATGPDGVVGIRQLALPPGSRLNAMPQYERFIDKPMLYVKFGLEAQGRFLARQPMLPEYATPPEKKLWESLATGEFIDPVTSLLLALEMLRRGERDRAREIATAMQTSLGPTSDLAALQMTLGLSDVWPDGLPLFQEQLQALRAANVQEGQIWLDRTLSRLLRNPPMQWTLNITSPWTSWFRLG